LVPGEGKRKKGKRREKEKGYYPPLKKQIILKLGIGGGEIFKKWGNKKNRLGLYWGF